jgi:hypothetical protein
MINEKAWDYSICNIGHPCKECTDTCSFRKEINMENDKYPCDICEPPHMCGYCNLCEEWEKTHPKKEIPENYDWE